jgi:hypothetical protein
MPATGADQADVRAESHHSPFLAATRVLASQPQHVTDTQIDRRHPDAQADSAAVAPVNAKRPMRSAGTRALMPEYSAATIRVSVLIASIWL